MSAIASKASSQDASLHVSGSPDGTSTRGRLSIGGGAPSGVTKTMSGESQLLIHLNSLFKSSRRVIFDTEISPCQNAPSKRACAMSRDTFNWGAQCFEIS